MSEVKKILPSIDFQLADWVAILICGVPAFYMLGVPAIYIWDEAVYANASLDIANGSSWLVPVHGDYNTKPPLVLWLQALCLKVMPSAELGVRLPSALAVTGILFLLQAGLKRWGYGFWTRFLVLICFVGHEGFIRHHIGRTGDLDAVMSFFVLSYSLVVLDSIFFKRWTGKHMLFFFLAFIAAFYAKSIAGWMMMAPLGVVWILSPMRKVLIRPRFIFGILLSMMICVLYYLVREQLQPGYMGLTWHSEYMRIAKNVMPWHEHPAAYYFKNFIVLKTFTPWVFLLVAAILYAFLMIRHEEQRMQLLQWMILGLGYMLLITIPAVKLEWYDAPAYPFFALITGVAAGHLADSIPSRWKLLLIIPILFILGRKLTFIGGDVQPRHPFENEGAILRQSDITPDLKVFMVVETPEHQLQLDFYRKTKEKDTGISVPVINQIGEVNTGDKVIISQMHHLKEIQALYTLDTLKTWKGLGYTIGVTGKR